MLRRALAAALLFVLAACATTPAAEKPADLTVLVSIDGFRADYLDRGVSPTLKRLAETGVRAEAMRPSFPSLTFPNHYTLVTGLRPDRHGIVNNSMEDPDHPDAVFTLSNREENTKPFWWDDAAPLWVTAEKAGVRTGTMFWPGSEVAIRGVRPQDWVVFDQKMPSDARVDRALTWLDRPAAERPKFVTLYFDIVDTQGHKFGPESAETNAAITEVDTAIARFLAGLEKHRLRANIVIVSDHGMAPIDAARAVNMDEIVAPALVHYVWPPGQVAGLKPAEGKTDADLAPLLGRHGHAECWKKADVPERFHMRTHRRVPPVVCLADTGWTLTSSAKPRTYPIPGGAHGYDPYDPLMSATFIANGPAFRHGVTLPVFDNVNVYPLLAGLLGVTPEPNDGDAAVLRPALRQ